MLNIMSLKKKKAEAAEAGPKKAKTSAAQIRLQKGARALWAGGPPSHLPMRHLSCDLQTFRTWTSCRGR